MTENIKNIKLLVDGIICTGCATDTENILLDLDGIEDVGVDFAKGAIEIEYNPEDITLDDILKKVTELSFKIKTTEES